MPPSSKKRRRVGNQVFAALHMAIVGTKLAMDAAAPVVATMSGPAMSTSMTKPSQSTTTKKRRRRTGFKAPGKDSKYWPFRKGDVLAACEADVDAEHAAALERGARCVGVANDGVRQSVETIDLSVVNDTDTTSRISGAVLGEIMSLTNSRLPMEKSFFKGEIILCSSS